MKPLVHARLSAKKYGGVPEDYMPIHDFIDSSKIAHPDIRHRAILHNSFGIYLAERLFGTAITLASGKQVCVRDIAEDHVFQDLGTIPTVSKWLDTMPIEPWMGGAQSKYIAGAKGALKASESAFDDIQVCTYQTHQPLRNILVD